MAATLTVNLSDSSAPIDVIDALFVQELVHDGFGFSRAVELHRLVADAPLTPLDASIVHVARGNRSKGLLLRGDGWLMKVMRWTDEHASVTVAALTDELAADVLAQATDGAEQPPADPEAVVTMAFWHGAQRCASRRRRDIASAPWVDARRNYTSGAQTAIETLVGVKPDAGMGRLLLFHGPPGTGKTTALRSLAHAWRDWCTVEVVIDADRLYADASYLMQVLLGVDDDDDDDTERWRLLVLEDCDELIRSDAKARSGQSLSRLLNVTDGLLGQGTRLLVALTTNEPLGALHPAITRPGRCLAEIHVGPLTRSEAVAWLGSDDGVPADGATLAELYAITNGAPIRATDTRSGAAYL